MANKGKKKGRQNSKNLNILRTKTRFFGKKEFFIVLPSFGEIFKNRGYKLSTNFVGRGLKIKSFVFIYNYSGKKFYYEKTLS